MPYIRTQFMHRLAAWGLVTDAAGAATREAAEGIRREARRTALLDRYREDLAQLSRSGPPPLHLARRA
ncbi:MAG: hypothetical protein NXH82_03865 [Rhodobacteraceae bacterium]|nr:hypothetical protein [Paracoccaceae bacterium]